jgi:hypothetical protein
MRGTIDTAAAVRFLSTLFVPGDTILFRPIETWVDSGKKQSQVDYKGIRHQLVGSRDQGGQWQPALGHLEHVLRRVHERIEHTHANLFFGVCPRFHCNSQFDLAWQIRTVRALYRSDAAVPHAGSRTREVDG